MKYLKAVIAGALLLFVCAWCYLAGQESGAAQAESELLRIQAAQAQEQLRAQNAEAQARAEREKASAHDRPGTPGWHASSAFPTDVIRHPDQKPPGLDLASPTTMGRPLYKSKEPARTDLRP